MFVSTYTICTYGYSKSSIRKSLQTLPQEYNFGQQFQSFQKLPAYQFDVFLSGRHQSSTVKLLVIEKPDDKFTLSSVPKALHHEKKKNYQKKMLEILCRRKRIRVDIYKAHGAGGVSEYN
jgi:hypothetical protein